MTTCIVETGLFRKKPCGHVAVGKCLNCDQALCIDHAVAQLTEAGHRTGKFMCKECAAAAKDQAKNLAAVARSQEAKKHAAIDKGLREPAAAPAAKKPPASTAAPAQPAASPRPKEPDALEFTPSGGKPDLAKKDDKPH